MKMSPSAMMMMGTACSNKMYDQPSTAVSANPADYIPFTKALKYYEKVRDLAPNEVEGYFGIANIAFLNRDAEKAVRRAR